jgi:hypothetical protein
MASRSKMPAHRSAEPGSLAVRVDFDDRVTPDVLRDLLGMAHKFVTGRRGR